MNVSGPILIGLILYDLHARIRIQISQSGVDSTLPNGRIVCSIQMKLLQTPPISLLVEGLGKGVGNQFAVNEAVVTLAMVLRRFDFEFDSSKFTNINIMGHPKDLEHPVGMRTGATIHTRKGLNMIAKRQNPDS